jgi:hypothetical protein
MSAHTPGPWMVLMEMNGKPSVWTDEPEDTRIRIARINCDVKKVDEQAFAEAVADARLFAAAPDLLAVLKLTIHILEAEVERTRDMMDRYPDDPNGPGALADDERILNLARAAIAKAGGK